jgi:molybdopterin-synthase adenylyltransferase
LVIDQRFTRQEALFGLAGQERIERTSIALVGLGGNGTQVAQNLVHLGTRKFILVEPGDLKNSSKNRYIGHRHDDPVPGTTKLAIAERMINAVSPDAEVIPVRHPLEHEEAQNAIANADVVFGCLDDDGPRFLLNELCAAKRKKLIDVATEIIPGTNTEPVRYGGRVFVIWERPGCLACCDQLDMNEVGMYLAGPEERKNREDIYGLRRQDPDGSGPSVVTLNGVVSAIAVTEFLVGITGLRAPVRLSVYRADLGRVTTSTDAPSSQCFTCAASAQTVKPN